MPFAKKSPPLVGATAPTNATATGGATAHPTVTATGRSTATATGRASETIPPKNGTPSTENVTGGPPISSPAPIKNATPGAPVVAAPIARAGVSQLDGPLPGQWAPWMAVYLAKLAESGQKGASAKAADVSLFAVWKRRHGDAEFARAENDAQRVFDDGLESEAYRRAVDGVTTVITRKDGSTFTKTEFSDTILLRLLERRETGSWRQKLDVKHQGQVEGVFMTRAERKADLERIMREDAEESVGVLSEGPHEGSSAAAT